MKKIVTTALLLIALVFLIQGTYIKAKALVAQVLIAHTWSAQSSQSRPSKPWRWFDAEVIAMLSVPRQGIEQYVMSNASGQALAFGPGHLASSASLEGSGHSAISGHRDTHFAFLRDMKVGDVIETHHFTGSKARYHVVDFAIIDTRYENVPRRYDDSLSLITCYPFNSINPGGPLRYVVQAVRESKSGQQSKPDNPA